MTNATKKPFRSILYNVLLIALAFALLGHAIWTNRAEIHRVFSRSLDYRLFLLAFAIYLVGLIVSFIRWYWLVRVVEPSFRLNSAILLGFIGSLFNLVIPGAVGGDLIKAAYLVKMDVKRTQAIASMVIDRIIGLLGLFILGGIAGAFMWSSVSNPKVKLLIGLVWTAVAAGFLALTVLFTPMLMSTLMARFKSGGRLAKVLDDLRIASSTYRGRLGVVAGALTLAIFGHGLSVFDFYLVSRMLFQSEVPSLGQHYVLVPLVYFTTAVPLPFGALGLSEEVSEQLFRLVGHPGSALALMGVRILMYGGGLISVGFYLANLRQVRELTDQSSDGSLAPVDAKLLVISLSSVTAPAGRCRCLDQLTRQTKRLLDFYLIKK